MKRRMVLVPGVVLALALAMPGLALATIPQPVSFDSQWWWGTEHTDSFSGSPLPGCAGGDVITFGKMVGHQNQPISQGVWFKRFLCAGGQATFSLQLEGRVIWTPSMQTSFRWAVVGSTGTLAGLHGTGTGYADDVDLVGGVDHYTGEMHFDP